MDKLTIELTGRNLNMWRMATNILPKSEDEAIAELLELFLFEHMNLPAVGEDEPLPKRKAPPSWVTGKLLELEPSCEDEDLSHEEWSALRVKFLKMADGYGLPEVRETKVYNTTDCNSLYGELMPPADSGLFLDRYYKDGTGEKGFLPRYGIFRHVWVKIRFQDFIKYYHYIFSRYSKDRMVSIDTITPEDLKAIYCIWLNTVVEDVNRYGWYQHVGFKDINNYPGLKW